MLYSAYSSDNLENTRKYKWVRSLTKTSFNNRTKHSAVPTLKISFYVLEEFQVMC